MKRWFTIIAVLVVGALLAVFAIAPAVVEGSQNKTLAHSPYAISAAAAALHETLFVADLHADSLLWQRNLIERSDRGHVDFPRLATGNVALQVFSATTKSPSGLNYERNDAAANDDITRLAMVQRWPRDTWTSLYARASYQLERLVELTEAQPDTVMLVRSRDDLARLATRRANGEAVIGAVYLIEGAHPLEGNLDNLDRLFAEGPAHRGARAFFR